MANNDESTKDAEIQLSFVQAEELTFDELSDSLKLAFHSMDDRNFDPVWVAKEECYSITERKQNQIFICDPFKGEIFDYLVKHKCRVVGPQCLLKCLAMNKPIPKHQNPLYSLVMKDVILTCTNMDRKQKDYIENKVQLLGGVMSKVLVPSVTHLVTNDVGSKKYFVAGSLNIPLMLPEWIDECWQKSSTDDFDCNDPVLLKKYKCPIFKGCCITVSQISSSERVKLSELIRQHGGTYNGNLECHKTTHLVLTEPVGKKYSSAQRWKVHCVTPQWIHDSIDKEYCLDWSLYAVNESMATTSTSTPEKNLNSVPRISKEISKLEFSRIEPIGGSGANIDETCMTEFELTMLRDSKKNSAEKSDNSATKSLKELDALDLQQIKKFGLFLDGCNIYFCGFNGQRLEKLHRIVNFGGGTRFSQVSESITHVLVNASSNDSYKQFSHEPHILDVQWLVDSCQQGKLLPESPYLKTQPSAPEESFSPITLKNRRMTENKENISIKEQTIVENKNETVDDVLSQYFEPAAAGDDSPGKDIEVDVHIGIFAKLRFTIHHSIEGDVREFLVDVVETREGIVVGKDSLCDYTIVPLTCDDYATAKGQVVTTLWIEHCATDESLYDAKKNILFQPLPEQLSTTAPLKGCVITLSLYTGTERESLMELAQALGAVCQEFFLRVPKGDALANTHLVIPETQGSKYNAAKRWSIPTVTKDWLLDTIRLKARPEERFYDVDGPIPNPLLIKSPEAPLRCETPDDDQQPVKAESSDTPVIPRKSSETPIDSKPENFDTPMTRRKSRVDMLKTESTNRRSSTNSRLSSMSGTPARYLDLSAMSAAFDSPKEDKQGNRRDSNLTFQADCKHYLQLAIEKHGEKSDNDSSSCIVAEDKALTGVTIVVSKRLAKTQGELNNLASSLGADYRWSFDENCTHLIHQGKQNDMSGDYRKAKNLGKFIVSPEWLTACKDEGKKVEESLYPFTFNPKMNLSSQITSKKLVLSQKVASPSISVPRQMDETPPKEPESDLYKQLDYLMSTAKPDSMKRLRSRRTESTSKTSPVLKLQSKMSEENIVESVPTESQGVGPITWDDPLGRLEKEKIAGIAGQNTQNTEDTEAEIVEEADIFEAQAAEQKKFIFTGIADNEKTDIVRSIQQLSGDVIDLDSFDDAATHLIASKPSKSEKFFASIAAGMWVLTPAYVKDSQNNGHFLPEDDYEWGCDSILEKESLSSDVAKLAEAARKWRQLLSSGKAQSGAFDGWKVILNAGGGPKEARLSRLLKAGKAEILDVEEPYDEPLNATHAFIEVTKKNTIDVNWECLVEHGVQCLRKEYLAAYLRDVKNVKTDEYIVDSAAQFMKKTSLKKRKSDDMDDQLCSASKMKRTRKA